MRHLLSRSPAFARGVSPTQRTGAGTRPVTGSGQSTAPPPRSDDFARRVRSYPAQAFATRRQQRAPPVQGHFAPDGRTATMAAARRIAALTHGDRAAWEGTAIFHELLRVALIGDDPSAAIAETLAEVHPEHRERYATGRRDQRIDHGLAGRYVTGRCHPGDRPGSPIGSTAWGGTASPAHRHALGTARVLSAIASSPGCGVRRRGPRGRGRRSGSSTIGGRRACG